MAFSTKKLLKSFCRRRFPAQENEPATEYYHTDDENLFPTKLLISTLKKTKAPPAPWTQIEAARSTTKLPNSPHKNPSFARVHNRLGKNNCKQEIEMWERYNEVPGSKTGEVGRIVVFIQKNQKNEVIGKIEVQTHEFEERWSGVKALRAIGDVVRYDLRIQTIKCVACGQGMDCNLCFLWDEKKRSFEPLLQTYASR